MSGFWQTIILATIEEMKEICYFVEPFGDKGKAKENSFAHSFWQ
jgi:hypothetical protein